MGVQKSLVFDLDAVSKVLTEAPVHIYEGPTEYVARARLKGKEYEPGRYEEELRLTRVEQLAAWEDRLVTRALDGVQYH